MRNREAPLAWRFYASTGVVIRDIRVEGLRIRIETEYSEKIVARARIDQRLKRIAETNAAFIELEVCRPRRRGYSVSNAGDAAEPEP